MIGAQVYTFLEWLRGPEGIRVADLGCASAKIVLCVDLSCQIAGKLNEEEFDRLPASWEFRDIMIPALSLNGVGN
jgi:hypothetical protein